MVRAKAPLVTLLLLVALAPAFPGASAAWTCEPGEDRSATRVSVLGSVYYQKLYQSSGYWIEEVWREANGEAGLQTTSGMSCVHQADRLVAQVCLNFCPIVG